MAADSPFFDSSYLVRLYLEDHGFAAVRKLAAEAPMVSSSWHAQSEIVAALHRAYREGRLEQGRYLDALEQFLSDSRDGHFHWLPLTDTVQQRLEQFFGKASSTTFLRAADALHLACAAEHGFKEVYSNDRHFLAATPFFELKGINVIGTDAP